jgi:hypothetical protein
MMELMENPITLEAAQEYINGADINGSFLRSCVLTKVGNGKLDFGEFLAFLGY